MRTMMNSSPTFRFTLYAFTLAGLTTIFPLGYLDVYLRRSFEPNVKNLQKRLFRAYAAEVALVDANGDGVISAAEGDIDTPSDGFADNARLFLPPTAFNRFAVTREINDGLLAPRFAPSQRAWVLSGSLVAVLPVAPASTGRDADDR